MHTQGRASLLFFKHGILWGEKKLCVEAIIRNVDREASTGRSFSLFIDTRFSTVSTLPVHEVIRCHSHPADPILPAVVTHTTGSENIYTHPAGMVILSVYFSLSLGGIIRADVRYSRIAPHM